MPNETPGTFDEEDDESWVPLEIPSSPPSISQSAGQDTAASAAVASTATTAPTTTVEISSTALQVARPKPGAAPRTTTSSTRVAVIGGSSERRPDSIQTLQRRVEMRRHLQQQLVHHPLQMLWSHFLWHMAQEFWNLDIQIRVALLMILLGISSKIFVLTTWYLWYPKTILLGCVMITSWIYLNAEYIPRRILGFFEAVMNLPNRIPEALEKLDPKQTRRLCMILLFLPTVLQMRTISFLADMNATEGGLVWNLLVAIIMTAISVYFLHPTPTRAARDVSQICLMVLYGSALWITLLQLNLLKVPSLSGPFFLSTGTLLLSYDDHDNMEWFSSLVRYSLRLTLRDILAAKISSVQEDEMLQIAILRWIVDYWSYTPPSTSNQRSQSSGATSGTASANASGTDMQWDELLPMLNVATDQMTSEVHSLQQQQQQQQSPQPSASTTSNTSSPADDSLHSFQTMLASMNVDDRAKPAVMAYKRNVEEFPPSRQLALAVSVVRRCPACLAFLWQLLVASPFQSLSTTFTIFLMLAPLIVLEVIRIRAWALGCEALSGVLDLDESEVTPTATNEAADRTNTTSTTSPADALSRIMSKVHPMTILLSGDDDTIVTTVSTNTTSDGVTSVTAQMTIPTLLIVWRNIQSSVSALEVGLTAARVAQTGAVAVAFAENVMSLAKFGSEVSRHGLLHGLTVIAKEVILDHGGDINSRPRGTAATFTQAAVSAVQNGQVVAHNLQVFADEDERVGQLVGPIVGLFGLIGSFFHHEKDKTDERQEKSDDRNEEESKSSNNNEAKSANAANVEGENDDRDDKQASGDIKTTHPEEDVAVRAEKPDDSGMGAAVPLAGTVEPSGTNAESVDTIQSCTDTKTETIVDDREVEKLENTQEVKLEKSNKDDLPVTPTAEVKEDLADVMELISDAFELNLIDENEKNEFCLKLSRGNEDKDMILGMKNTLRGLIESSQDNQEKAAVATLKEAKADATTNTAISTTKKQNDASRNDEKVLVLITKDSDDAGWRPIVETVAPDYSERVANAVRPEEEEARALLSGPERTVATSSSTRTAEGDEDGIPTVETSAPRRDDDNVWVKVGGGIAVLGAVVGGAFLAMNQDNPNNSEGNTANDGRNNNNRSSVTIERLDENDEEGDSWEATARDASRQAQ